MQYASHTMCSIQSALPPDLQRHPALCHRRQQLGYRARLPGCGWLLYRWLEILFVAKLLCGI